MALTQWVWHVVSVLFLLYLGQAVWSMYSLYHPSACKEDSGKAGQSERCIHPIPSYKNNAQLRIHASLSHRIGGKEVFRFDNIDVSKGFEKTVEVDLPLQTRRNGSLWFHVYLLPQSDGDKVSSPQSASWYLVQSVAMTKYIVPEAKAFQLVSGGNNANDNQKPSDGSNIFPGNKSNSARPVTHWQSKLPLVVVDNPIALNPSGIPAEVYHLLKVNSVGQYYPLFYADELSFRMKNLVEVTESTEKVNLTVVLQPVSIGKLRMLVVALQSTVQLRGFGFSDKDIDEVRSIFTETNFYLLALTMFVAGVHMLLDFLAFKNDIHFWRNRKTMTGLSSRAVVWSCFSHLIIVLYLFDQGTSKLVLVPAGIGAVIETVSASSEEKDTEAFDSQGMKYLGFILIPLCLCGAVYSLLYVPHKSWYSWAINSLANGVYAFGFLFMLPQLFINYKLKSVAHLPWRTFMYKAFNTFIDDLFAFIIHMPTSHRLACFRDDVVFVIYLYQRWLYPVDKTRVNEFGESFDDETSEETKKHK